EDQLRGGAIQPPDELGTGHAARPQRRGMDLRLHRYQRRSRPVGTGFAIRPWREELPHPGTCRASHDSKPFHGQPSSSCRPDDGRIRNRRALVRQESAAVPENWTPRLLVGFGTSQQALTPTMLAIAVPALVFAIMLVVGAGLTPEEFRQVRLQKRLGAIATAAQFLLLPPAAVGAGG